MVNDRDFLLRQAWQEGNLEYLVDEYQLPVYNALWKAINSKGVLKYCCNIARRFGKTHLSSIIAIEYGLRNPGSQINYACVTDKAMKKILRGIMPTILRDCPPDMKPERVGGVWEFKNGSAIHTAGVNNQHADDLRGTASHLNIVDEAGQIDELEYLVRSVLLPQQLTVSGTMLLLSTPPSKTDHDYTAIYHECKEDGNLSEFTIYDNAKIMADAALFETYVRESGGKDSTHWQREYEVKFVTDTNKIILPEWHDWKERNTYVPEINDKFKFWHKHVSMDLGFKDFTAMIYGYYDFERAKLVIQRDMVIVGEDVTSASIANTTLAIENELWGEKSNPKRISDNNQPILLNDISHVHNVLFHPTSKDELMAMVNKTRAWIGAGKLEIYPECKYLLGCLEFGVWNKERDKFATSKKFGHYDGLAALIYLLRYVDEFTNPVPLTYNISQDDHWIMPEQLTGNQSGLKKLTKQKQTRRGVK